MFVCLNPIFSWLPGANSKGGPHLPRERRESDRFGVMCLDRIVIFKQWEYLAMKSEMAGLNVVITENSSTDIFIWNFPGVIRVNSPFPIG